ncbi:MAG TPA: iron-sulfur cluster assembly protein [Nitrososphaera sp.]|nr:iron-sulfur cluster assembly protein [Nitrososphaera sp.]
MSGTNTKSGSNSNANPSSVASSAQKSSSGSDDLQQTRRKIFDELTKIVDPEIGVSIMELELVDKVDINSGKVAVDLHLTSPFCPAVFGFKIAQDVRDNIYKLSGINDVKVQVSNHFMADAINKQVNESKYPAKPAT